MSEDYGIHASATVHLELPSDSLDRLESETILVDIHTLTAITYTIRIKTSATIHALKVHICEMEAFHLVSSTN